LNDFINDHNCILQLHYLCGISMNKSFIWVMDENLQNIHTSSIFHLPYFTSYGFRMCAKKKDTDMDYPTIIFSSNKIRKSSLWLNFNYCKWCGKYCQDVVAFLYLINYVISYVIGKWVPLYVLVKGVGRLQSFWDYNAL
jgi:hypothetical protein